jgi:hypothetical protein
VRMQTALESLLPPITPVHLDNIEEPIAYIGAAGFEGRALSVLDEAALTPKRFEYAIGVQYRPFDERNMVQEFTAKAKNLDVPERELKWVTYDRYAPQEFLTASGEIQTIANNVSSLVIDISAMSKFLIVTLLQSLRNVKCRVEITYTEADVYHPTKDVFEWHKQLPHEKAPEFLTTDIYKIVTTTSLSSSSMQGYPLLMIAFPTFNYRELLALLNEMTPQHLIILEGKPHENHNAWRLDAIRWINGKSEDSALDKRTVSTFDYSETIAALEEIYQRFHHSHKLIVSPTGSKLQTFGVFLFKQMHPDIQLIYPVTRRFASEYTSGCSAIWQISIPCLPDLVQQLDAYRKWSLHTLREAIRLKLQEQRSGYHDNELE